MDQKTSNTLRIIASGALAIGGLLLLLISIFGETKDYRTLTPALAAVVLYLISFVCRGNARRNIWRI